MLYTPQLKNDKVVLMQSTSLSLLHDMQSKGKRFRRHVYIDRNFLQGYDYTEQEALS